MQNLKNLDETFFFLAGCGHTGSSIIARFFGSHEQILFIPKESGILLANRYHIMGNLVNEFIYQKKKLKKNFILEKTPRHIWHFDYARKIFSKKIFLISFRNPISTLISLKNRYQSWEPALQRVRDDTVMSIRQLCHQDVKPVLFELFTNKPIEYFNYAFLEFDLKASDSMLNFFKKKLEWNKVGDNLIRDSHDKLRNQQINSPIKIYKGIDNTFQNDEIKEAKKRINEDKLAKTIFSDLKKILIEDAFISKNLEINKVNFLSEWDF